MHHRCSVVDEHRMAMYVTGMPRALPTMVNSPLDLTTQYMYTLVF